MALKRISFKANTKTHLEFITPATVGEHKLVLYVISDSYLGLDQEYDVLVNVGE